MYLYLMGVHLMGVPLGVHFTGVCLIGMHLTGGTAQKAGTDELVRE
jgi:hypothetical protein